MARDYSTNRYKDAAKKIREQKKVAESKRKSVTDLKKEVSSNKAISSSDRAKKSNIAFNKRIQALLGLIPSVPKDVVTRGNLGQKTTPKKESPPSKGKVGRLKLKRPRVTEKERREYSAYDQRMFKDRTTIKPKRRVTEEERRALTKLPKAPPRRVTEEERRALTKLPKAPPRRVTEQERKALSKLPKPKAKKITQAEKSAIRDTKQVVVKSGDTLTAIAKRKGTTVANLLKINPQIKNADSIKPGQKIRFGGSDASTKRIGQISKAPNKPRTIAEARKQGKKYFYDSKGNRKIAVTAEELKKSGKTLAQWLKG